MKKFLFFLSIIALVQVSFQVFAAPQQLKIQYDEKYQSPDAINQPSSTVLKGSVKQEQELPSGMYGMWQVDGVLLETNDYNKFNTKSSDVWVLRKDGPFVTLINPQNGASATITITTVKNDTATFVRAIKTYNSREAEQVTITLQGNTFTGTDLITSEEIVGGQQVSDVARYRITGKKIAGQTILRPKGAATLGE